MSVAKGVLEANSSVMTGKVTRETIQLDIKVGGNQAKRELGQLEEAARDLNQEQKALRAEKAKLTKGTAEEKKRITELNRELKANKTALTENKNRQTALRNEIGLTGLTVRQLNTHIKRLTYLQHNATPGTDAWKRYNAELVKATAHKERLQKGVTVMGQAMKRAATTVNHYAGMMMAAGFAIYKVYDIFVKGNAELSDQLSDVEKHTNLTRKELNALYLDLRKADTRTSREELLKLASVAGKLGIDGRQNILEFVKAADQITVALGEDMGKSADDAVKMIGKIVDVFDLDKVYGIEQAMLKAGSAVNTLGQSSSANEGYIVEWTNRVQGIAKTANIAMTDVMGLASANDQLAQSAEVSSTVFTQVVPNMFKDTATYAKVAGMSLTDFTKLLNTDANEAFLSLLDGLNGNNDGLDIMTQKLDTLGLDGKRVISVLLALARDTDKIREAQDIANASFEKGSSITDEFSKKNNNLAGNLAKIGKALKEITTNSGMVDWLTKITDKLANLATKSQSERVLLLADNLKKLEKEFVDQNAAVDKLLTTYDELKAKQSLTKDEQQLLNDTIKKIGEIVPVAITEFNKYGDAIGISKGKIIEAREAQRLLNLEMRKGVVDDLVDIIEKNNKRIEQSKDYISRIQKNLKDEALLEKAARLTGKTRNELENDYIGGIQTANKDISERNKTLAQTVLKLKEIGLTEEEISLRTGISIQNMTEIVNKYLDAINKTPGEINVPDTPDPDNTQFEPISAEKLKDQEQTLETSLRNRQNIIKQQLLQQQITQAEYNQQMYILEQAHLLSVRELYRQNGKDISEIQGQIFDKQLEYTQQIAKMIDMSSDMSQNLLSVEQKMFQAVDAEMDAYMDKYHKKLTDEVLWTKKAEEEKQKAREKGTKDQRKQADAIQEIGDVVNSYINDAFTNQLDEFQGFGDTLVLASIDILRRMVPIWSAQILGYSLSSMESVATWGVAGVAKWVAIMALMNGALSAVEGSVKSGINKRREMAQKRDGGYATVYGADDGRQYRARVLTAAGTGMLPNSPVVMPSGILASEAGREYYVDNQSLSSQVRDAMGLRIADHVAIIDAMKNNTVLTQRIAGGYSSVLSNSTNLSPLRGTGDSGGGANLAQPYTPFTPDHAILNEIKRHNKETVEAIRKLKIYTSIEDVNDGQKRYTDIQITRGI